jgi:hypothetical protein
VTESIQPLLPDFDGQPVVPTPPVAKKAPTWFVAVLVLVMLGCCGGGIAIASSDDSKPASQPAATKPAATKPAAAKPAAAKPAATTVKPVAAATPLTTAARISAWYAGGGAIALNAITDDLGAEQIAAGNVDISGTRTACASLKSDVAAAKAYGPIPAADVQKPWAAALTAFGKAAADCVRGVDNMDGSLIDRSGRELSTGTTDLDRAASILQSY